MINRLINTLDRIEDKLTELANKVGSELKKAIDSRIELEQVKREMESWKNSSKHYGETAEKRQVRITELKDLIDVLEMERPKKKLKQNLTSPNPTPRF